MSADPDIVCNEAPAPQEPINAPEPVERVAPGTSNAKLFIGVVLFALVAGVAITFAVLRGGGDAVSTSVETATDGKGSAEKVATATDSTEAPPAECVGEIADADVRWYCTKFLPFAKKVSADHDRLDRLEAAGKDSGGSGTPTTLWVIVIAIGLLTAYNTVKVHSGKTKPPAG